MPNPLNPPWNTIIPMIPVQEHSVEVTRYFWDPLLRGAGCAGYVAPIFGALRSVRLSRQRLLTHAYPTNQQKCLEILMWGYPTGMRGAGHKKFLVNLNGIALQAPVAAAWPAYHAAFKPLGGLGISTISKLAYFYGHVFAGSEALILDRRIITVLAAGRWVPLAMPGLTYNHAANQYLDYLRLMTATAAGLGCAPENLEFVLFALGNSF